MIIILTIITILLSISSLIIINDFTKRICNSISYVEILKVQGKITAYEAIKLQNILRGDTKND